MTTLKLDERGLIPAVVQDRLTGEIRMVAWMNEDAVAATLASGRATFFSRSRGRLWEKGESSGHTLHVSELLTDCDADTLLVLVDPAGPSCHTGQENCFFRRVTAADAETEASERWHLEDRTPARPELEQLGAVIGERARSSAEKSYTKSLLDAGSEKIGKKLREEADELARAIDGETDDRVASEAADVLFHLMVGLQHRGVPLRAVLAELSRRAGVSGHTEKASRAPKGTDGSKG